MGEVGLLDPRNFTWTGTVFFFSGGGGGVVQLAFGTLTALLCSLDVFVGETLSPLGVPLRTSRKARTSATLFLLSVVRNICLSSKMPTLYLSFLSISLSVFQMIIPS